MTKYAFKWPPKSFPIRSIGSLLRQLVMMALLLFYTLSDAAPVRLDGSWFQAPDEWSYQGPVFLPTGLEPVDKVAATGGHFLFQTEFSISQSGRYVLDFKNTSVIGQFRHFVFDAQGHSVAELDGGIQSEAENPFLLRHGRELDLPPGTYRLVTELKSPFFLAQPQPYLDSLAHYQKASLPAITLVLVCMGIFIGLGIYYAALALVRRRVAEGMYTLFIFGNLLFNGTALLVYPQLFGMHWFYLISVPILFSNCAYIFFVMALLEINKTSHFRLYRAGMVILMVLGCFILIAAFRPNWSLELDRYGVGIFLTYGLSAGIIRARQGHLTARLYLVAIATFFLLGSFTISQSSLHGIYTIYIEHLGLGAVAVEVILLALVLSYQFAQLHQDKEHALARAAHSARIAYTDALTNLPNRYVLEEELERLPFHGSLTFIDLDGLKYYNDKFGHERGDDLLRSFAGHLVELLNQRASLHRLGGDEFAITCPDGDLAWIEAMLSKAIARMRLAGYEFAGASSGSVHVHENPSKKELKHIADTRMYDNKRRRRVRDQLPDAT